MTDFLIIFFATLLSAYALCGVMLKRELDQAIADAEKRINDRDNREMSRDDRRVSPIVKPQEPTS